MDIYKYMKTYNKIHLVDLTSIEDCFQMGEFERLVDLFLYLLGQVLKGVPVVLLRYPENSSPIPCAFIANLQEFKVWVSPFLGRI